MSVISKLATLGAAGNAGGAWDISSASFDQDLFRLYIGAEEGTPQGLFFKPDGTKVYVTGYQSDAVQEYDLSTAWSLSTGTFVQSFSILPQESGVRGVFFKDDGTKMYITGAGGDDVNEYDLSTAWDISTASYLQNFSVSAQDTVPEDVFFGDSGTKMYVVGNSGNDINQYSLSTAWDVSTASYVQNLAAGDTDANGVYFKSDGTKMYISAGTADSIREYTLSTAWDISSATFVQSFSVAAQETNPESVSFKSDGTKMYVLGALSRNILEYSLSTAWDISTAVFSEPSADYFNVSSQEIQPFGLFFKPDGTKMYTVGNLSDEVNEYDLSTAWDISTASHLQAFSVATQLTVPRELFFKPDGTKMYIVDVSNDDVSEYTLSTAWDISTASYVQALSVALEEASPFGLFFKPDGTKMYIVGNNGDEVNEYDLSTAWDISTASSVQAFSVATENTNPSGVFFKDDGTKMYVCSYSGSTIYQYDLSTEWDISTASYVHSFNFTPQDTNVYTVAFKDDGTVLYALGDTFNAVYAYNLQ